MSNQLPLGYLHEVLGYNTLMMTLFFNMTPMVVCLTIIYPWHYSTQLCWIPHRIQILSHWMVQY